MAPANQVCPCSDLDYLQAFVFEGDGLPSGCLACQRPRGCIVCCGAKGSIQLLSILTIAAAG